MAAITHRIDNQRAAAGQFGADCVGMFLTTPATKIAALQPCLTLPEVADRTAGQPRRGATAVGDQHPESVVGDTAGRQPATPTCTR